MTSLEQSNHANRGQHLAQRTDCHENPDSKFKSTSDLERDHNISTSAHNVVTARSKSIDFGSAFDDEFGQAEDPHILQVNSSTMPQTTKLKFVCDIILRKLRILKTFLH